VDLLTLFECQPELQWGRDQLIAEMCLVLATKLTTMSFNGAAIN